MMKVEPRSAPATAGTAPPAPDAAAPTAPRGDGFERAAALPQLALRPSEPQPIAADARSVLGLRAFDTFARVERTRLRRARKAAFADRDPIRGAARWTRAVDALFAAAAARLVTELGPAPTEHALIAMGSYARRELAPRSDADYAILIASDTPEVRAWFTAFAKRLAQDLAAIDPEAPAPCTFLSPSGSAQSAFLDTPEGLAARELGTSADLPLRSPRDRDYIRTALSATRLLPGASSEGAALHRRFERAVAEGFGPPAPAIDPDGPRFAFVREILRSLRDPFGVPAAATADWNAGGALEPSKAMKRHVPLDPAKAIAGGVINVKHDLARALDIPVSALRVLFGVSETGTAAVLDALEKSGKLDPHLAVRLRETVSACLRLRAANHLRAGKEEDRLLEVTDADRRVVRRMVPVLLRLRKAMDPLTVPGADPRRFDLASGAG